MNIKEEFLNAKRRLFDKVWGKRLNPEQCRAVFTTKGPVLVLAGAGSGKTTVLVNRIAYIIKYGDAYFDDTLPEGVDENTVNALKSAIDMPEEDIEEILPGFITRPCPPWAVLAITFTNKAAGEIRDRLKAVFEDEEVSSSVWAGTFHSICLRILRKYADRLGYRQGFSIYDTDDQKRLVLACMKELEIDEKRLNPKAVQGEISRSKDALVSYDDYELTRDPRTKDIKAVYKLYQERLMQYNAMDFDDIIMRTVELLEGEEDIREYYQNKFKYVLVDEYQDTNYAQFVLTKLLADKRRNIMVVGDDDQSIYRFRGATVENILNFDKTYPDATVVKLEQNYRSTANILNAANAIIGNNEKRHQKRLWCAVGDGDKITVKQAEDQNAEGKYIVEKIVGAVYKEKRKYSDFAVLYRVNALGRSLQTAFTKSGVPFRVIGDMGFYDHKEVKDMVAYLSVLGNLDDDLRLKRIINEPKRKIGASTIEAVESLAHTEGLSMYEILRRIDEYPVLAKSRDKIAAFTSLMDSIKTVSDRPSELISETFLRTGYRDMLLEEGPIVGEGKVENVEELISAAVEYETRMEEAEEEPTLRGFLEEVFLVSDVDKYDDTADAVVLMTVHAAKGLEFPVVFIAGMEEGIFPSDKDGESEDALSEERRLAYVAITRAKEKLYITHVRERMMYGRTRPGLLSRFAGREMPEGLIERDVPRTPPPRQTFTAGAYRERPSGGGSFYNNELRRAPSVGSSNINKKQGAGSFGIEKIGVGARVKHAHFGLGTILSSRDMGGDVLYEVRFDSGEVKKLMATFAKLEKV